MEWLGRYPNQQDREIDRLEERLQAAAEAILVLKSCLARMRTLVRCSEDCRTSFPWHTVTCAVTQAHEILERAEVGS